jgi:hypothetical protein
MGKQLTAEDARESLHMHAAGKGEDLHAIYGPRIGWNQLLQILEDRSFVRYPCEVVFGDKGLRQGEMAHPEPIGPDPNEGFKLYVHPYFATDFNQVPCVVLYQLVLVNYGEFASEQDAEIFGANALGIDQEAYYQRLCAMADELDAFQNA